MYHVWVVGTLSIWSSGTVASLMSWLSPVTVSASAHTLKAIDSDLRERVADCGCDALTPAAGKFWSPMLVPILFGPTTKPAGITKLPTMSLVWFLVFSGNTWEKSAENNRHYQVSRLSLELAAMPGYFSVLCLMSSSTGTSNNFATSRVVCQVHSHVVTAGVGGGSQWAASA